MVGFLLLLFLLCLVSWMFFFFFILSYNVVFFKKKYCFTNKKIDLSSVVRKNRIKYNWLSIYCSP